jgi:hypothetical protein
MIKRLLNFIREKVNLLRKPQEVEVLGEIQPGPFGSDVILTQASQPPTFTNSCHELTDLGGGLFRSTIYAKPAAYYNRGVFRRIANEWQDSDVPSRPHIVTSAPFLISVGNDGLRRIHPTREQDRYLEIGAPFVKVGGAWTQAILGTPDRIGNLLRWGRENVNTYIYMGGHFVKMAMLLKNGWVPEDHQFAFPVGLVGLTRDGGQIFSDGQEVMCISSLTVIDRDNLADVRPIAHRFVWIADKWHVLLTLPNLIGMSSPLVDPTLTLQPDAASGVDCHINSASPDQDNEVNTQIGLGTASLRGLISFDLSSIPGAATVTSATLSFWRGSSWHNGAHTITWHRILAANTGWLEKASWNFADGSIAGTDRWAGDAGGDGGADAGCSQSGTDFAAAVLCSRVVDAEPLNTQLDFVMDAAETGAMVGANHGMVGYANTGWQNKYIWSSDHVTPANRPRLVVNYTLPSVSAASRSLRVAMTGSPLRGA